MIFKRNCKEVDFWSTAAYKNRTPVVSSVENLWDCLNDITESMAIMKFQYPLITESEVLLRNVNTIIISAATEKIQDDTTCIYAIFSKTVTIYFIPSS